MLTAYHAYVNGYCRYWLYLIPYGYSYCRDVPVDGCFANTGLNDSPYQQNGSSRFLLKVITCLQNYAAPLPRTPPQEGY